MFCRNYLDYTSSYICTHKYVNPGAYDEAMSVLSNHKNVFSKFDYIGNYSTNDLVHLKKGDVVKFSHKNETFWVELTSNDGNKLEGKVENNLYLEHGFYQGDLIKFNAVNVIRYESNNKSSWL